jgi:hypothetical protein
MMRPPWRKRVEPCSADEADPIATVGNGEPLVGPLDPDLPVMTEDDDGLGRGKFAGHLARQIELAPRSGFVVALVGPWGSGKTSVLHMVQKRLNDRQSANGISRIVVPFNPWLVSGSEQLVSQFVAELASALPRELGTSRGAKAAERLRGYAGGLQTLEGIPGVGWAFGLGGALMNEAGRRKDDSPTTLFEERDHARRALRELDVHIVVLIDDVDRLQNAEIRDLMRMIKMVGDFPNVTYLLAFDREVVRSALDVGQADGGEYLEKIVQIEYRLPEPPPEMLEVLLLKAINRAIKGLPDDRIDRGRWESIYTQIVRPLVARPRHVRRFGNALPLAIDLAGNEIDTVDVIALTALQTLLPRFHDRLLDLCDDLTPRVRNFVVWTSEDEAKRDSAVRLNEAASESGAPTVARATYELLFPASMAALTNSYTDDQATWHARRRVADREAFDTYFTANLPEGVPSVTEVREVVAAFAQGPEELLERLDAQPTNQLPGLMHRIWGHIEEIDLEDVRSCLKAIDSQVARLSDVSRGIWTPADQGRSFVRDLVSRFPAGEERDGVVRQKFEMSPSLTDKFMWLRSVNAWENKVDPFCDPKVLRALKSEFADEVLAATVDDLLAEPRASWLLRTAEDDGGDDASRRIAVLLEDGRLLPTYLGGFLVLAGSSADYHLQFDELEKRQGRHVLTAALGRVNTAEVDDVERSRLLQLGEHYADQVNGGLDDSTGEDAPD